MSMRQKVSSRNFGSSNPNIAYFVTHETKRRKTLRFAFYGVFVSDVCLHLWSQNRYQNANRSVLCACFGQVLKHDSKADKISCVSMWAKKAWRFSYRKEQSICMNAQNKTKSCMHVVCFVSFMCFYNCFQAPAFLPVGLWVHITNLVL